MSVQLLSRAFAILESLSVAKDGLGVTALAERTGLSKSTVHRIVTSLVEGGYVGKNADTGHYELGIKLIEMVSYYINGLELHTEARPYLRGLTATLNLTTHLGILEGADVLYIEKLDIFPNVRLYSQVGFRVPAYCSSLGKCLLSGLSGGKLDTVLAPCDFVQYTERTITDRSELKRHLVDVRRQGYAVDNEEQEVGHRCIGAPIFDYRGDIVAAISASGSTTVLGDERILPVAEQVKQAALQVSRRLGYTG